MQQRQNRFQPDYLPCRVNKQVAEDWASRGFSCDLWTDPPGQRWEDFTHATDELVVVMEGQMEFEITGRVCHPEVGEELLIPGGAVHSARNIGTTTARWLYCYKRWGCDWAVGRGADMEKKPHENDVSIGKFDILATYTYAHALLGGLDDDEAKQRGMVAAIMGVQARLGVRKEHHEEFQAQKEAAEKKKKTTITAESFDKQVAHKMGEFFDEVFLPTLKKLVEAGLMYDEVKRLVKIPSTWGAKITGEQFEERVTLRL